MSELQDVSILDLQTAQAIGPSDLLYVGVVDTGVTEGYNDAKGTLGDIATAFVNSFSYTQLLQTTAKTIVGAINELNTNMPADIENVEFPTE